MKKVLGTALAAGAAIIGSAVMAGSANAAVTFNVGVATDYVFRGIDQFGGSVFDQTEAFGGADWASSKGAFYAGTWLSNTGTVPATSNIEYDLYGGWKPSFGGISWDLGGIWYGYTDTRSLNQHKASYGELKVAGTLPVGAVTLGGKLYWSPNFAGSFDGSNSNNAWYGEINAAYTFKSKATLSGAVGYQTVDNFGGGSSSRAYTTANIGVTYPITDHLSVDGRYINDSGDVTKYFNPLQDKNLLVATLTATF